MTKWCKLCKNEVIRIVTPTRVYGKGTEFPYRHKDAEESKYCPHIMLEERYVTDQDPRADATEA